MKLNSKLGTIFSTIYLVFTIVIYLTALFCTNVFCKVLISLPILIELPLIAFFTLFTDAVWIWPIIFVFLNAVAFYFLGMGVEKVIQQFKQAQRQS